MRIESAWVCILFAAATFSCQPADPTGAGEEPAMRDIDKRVNQYTSVRLTADLSGLSEAERAMVPLLIDAAKAMAEAFWKQAYGDKDELLGGITDPAYRRYAEINYGPWDRLDGEKAFIEGFGPKPLGANLYPADVTREEFEAAAGRDATLESLYTVVRRDDAGALTSVPYSEAYSEQYEAAASRLEEAAELAEDAGLATYLRARAKALRSDEYRASDLAWMDMKTNTLEVVIGPIETYEDLLFGYKAANTAYVLVKDQSWSERLQRYAEFLPDLQRGLPVPDAYKKESPGADADLGAYDTLYVAGDANAAVKSIAFNLPNDETVQLERGTRRVQLKSAMRAKFDEVLVPIGAMLIDEAQRPHVTFDAFFANTMFHEIAHGLGIKKTLSGAGTVREVLKDRASALEEGKADFLGLYMIHSLAERNELEGADPRDNDVTFLASIFRSIRFGSTSAHGLANLIRFNFFEEQGAFSRSGGGRYSVDFEKLPGAIAALSERLLRLQGDGDYEAVAAFVEQYGKQDATLTADLARLEDAVIPVDIVFEQGLQVLGL